VSALVIPSTAAPSGSMAAYANLGMAVLLLGDWRVG
jgi:hypothetical protein